MLTPPANGVDLNLFATEEGVESLTLSLRRGRKAKTINERGEVEGRGRQRERALIVVGRELTGLVEDDDLFAQPGLGAPGFVRAWLKSRLESRLKALIDRLHDPVRQTRRGKEIGGVDVVDLPQEGPRLIERLDPGPQLVAVLTEELSPLGQFELESGRRWNARP